MFRSSNRALACSDNPTLLNISYIDWLHGLFEHSCKPKVVVFRLPHVNRNYYMLLKDVKSGDKLDIAYE